jgi:hypothetical protein
MFELVTCTLPFLTIFGYPLNLISIVSPNKKASQLTLEGFVEGKDLRVPKKNRTPILFKQLFFEKN